MANENKAYNRIPELKPYRGDDPEAARQFEDLKRALSIIKLELARLQKEKTDS